MYFYGNIHRGPAGLPGIYLQLSCAVPFLRLSSQHELPSLLSLLPVFPVQCAECIFFFNRTPSCVPSTDLLRGKQSCVCPLWTNYRCLPRFFSTTRPPDRAPSMNRYVTRLFDDSVLGISRLLARPTLLYQDPMCCLIDLSFAFVQIGCSSSFFG